MSKRNYAAERREAADYADKVMDGVSATCSEWAAMWERVYAAYLVGLRAGLRR